MNEQDRKPEPREPAKVTTEKLERLLAEGRQAREDLRSRLESMRTLSADEIKSTAR